MSRRPTYEDLIKLPLVKVVDHNYQPANRSIVIPEKTEKYSGNQAKNIPTSSGKGVNPFERFMKAEDHLQHQVISFIQYQYPKLKFHHSPDAGKRTPFEQ